MELVSLHDQISKLRSLKSKRLAMESSLTNSQLQYSDARIDHFDLNTSESIYQKEISLFNSSNSKSSLTSSNKSKLSGQKSRHSARSSSDIKSPNAGKVSNSEIVDHGQIPDSGGQKSNSVPPNTQSDHVQINDLNDYSREKANSYNASSHEAVLNSSIVNDTFLNGIEDYATLQRQYQTTLKLLYESNVEQSKLRTLLDYATSSISKQQLQIDLNQFLLTQYRGLFHGLKLPEDLSLETFTQSFFIQKELQSTLHRMISLQQDLDNEKKRANEADAAMLILRTQYEESIALVEKLKTTIKEMKRKQALDLMDNVAFNSSGTPPRSPANRANFQNLDTNIIDDSILNNAQSRSRRRIRSVPPPPPLDEPKYDSDNLDAEEKMMRSLTHITPVELATIQPVNKKQNQTAKHEIRAEDSSLDGRPSMLLDIDLGNGKKDQVLIYSYTDPLLLSVGFLQDHGLPEIYLEPLISYISEMKNCLLSDEMLALPSEPNYRGPAENYNGSQDEDAQLQNSKSFIGKIPAPKDNEDEQENSESPLFSHLDTESPQKTPNEDMSANQYRSVVNFDESPVRGSSDNFQSYVSPSLSPEDNSKSISTDDLSSASPNKSTCVSEDIISSPPPPPPIMIIERKPEEEFSSNDPKNNSSEIKPQANETMSRLLNSESFKTAIDAFDRATLLINEGDICRAAPLYDHALSLFQAAGIPEQHLQVMEEEAMYWVNQAHAQKSRPATSVDLTDI